MKPALSLQVLNVGDGACSVLKAGDETGILDCGSWRSSGEQEARVLMAALGRRLKNVSTLIVSHFDADHWRGLQALPRLARPEVLPDRVSIRYPGLPKLARQTVMAYIALKSIDGAVSVRALDLLDAWRPVAAVTPQPLFAGDVFTLGAESFMVLWPPRHLPNSWSVAARRTLDELERVAARLPVLRRALDDAYSHAWPQTDQIAAAARDNGYDQLHGYLADLDEAGVAELNAEVEEDLRAEIDSPQSEEGRDAGDTHTPLFADDSQDRPDRPQLRKLAERLGILNNHLSLVLATPQGRILALGDLQGWSLNRLAGTLERSQYKVVLAPHHGTVKVPSTFPAAEVCVLQNGPSHFERRTRHESTHSGCYPVSIEHFGHWAACWRRKGARPS
ncbi:MBL fold metallo-hydrolase [Kribbella sp. VKM Ac-2568]|uniref:MBL fold metallo-hydrolase n=1 Tax=Kribbella sp. VKM Ac-2568 TaxID=2512219 RepID=UPI00104D6E05|nr:MBL fold metallo-hydrolase [Kribbella sp. VKM Ac-2568]TCM42495.1 metallo-beta-lactamase superfamily protein [Kribbella sp. VKM Ac-2568]